MNKQTAELLKANGECQPSSIGVSAAGMGPGSVTVAPILHRALEPGEQLLELNSSRSTVSSATPPNLLSLQRMILLTSDIVSDSASSSSPSHGPGPQYHHHQPYLNYSHNFATSYDIPVCTFTSLRVGITHSSILPSYTILNENCFFFFLMHKFHSLVVIFPAILSIFFHSSRFFIPPLPHCYYLLVKCLAYLSVSSVQFLRKSYISNILHLFFVEFSVLFRP